MGKTKRKSSRGATMLPNKNRVTILFWIYLICLTLCDVYENTELMQRIDFHPSIVRPLPPPQFPVKFNNVPDITITQLLIWKNSEKVPEEATAFVNGTAVMYPPKYSGDPLVPDYMPYPTYVDPTVWDHCPHC